MASWLMRSSPDRAVQVRAGICKTRNPPGIYRNLPDPPGTTRNRPGTDLELVGTPRNLAGILGTLKRNQNNQHQI